MSEKEPAKDARELGDAGQYALDHLLQVIADNCRGLPEKRLGMHGGPIKAEIKRYVQACIASAREQDDEEEWMKELSRRDYAEKTVDALLELIGVDYEWSSDYEFDDAVAEAEEKLASAERNGKEMRAALKAMVTAFDPYGTGGDAYNNHADAITMARAALATPAEGTTHPCSHGIRTICEICKSSQCTDRKAGPGFQIAEGTTQEGERHITEPDQNGQYGVWIGKTHCVAEGLTLGQAEALAHEATGGKV
jgi:hypothetical protein